MRLWSLHPKYLDAKGIVALWREGLLAKNVVEGKTKGYTRHPQLIRFKNTHCPSAAVADYLMFVYEEASLRQYSFDRSKIIFSGAPEKIRVSSGQLDYEFKHLLSKLKTRDPDRYRQFSDITFPEPHPMFTVVDGDVEDWEIIPAK